MLHEVRRTQKYYKLYLGGTYACYRRHNKNSPFVF